MVDFCSYSVHRLKLVKAWIFCTAPHKLQSDERCSQHFFILRLLKRSVLLAPASTVRAMSSLRPSVNDLESIFRFFCIYKYRLCIYFSLKINKKEKTVSHGLSWGGWISVSLSRLRKGRSRRRHRRLSHYRIRDRTGVFDVIREIPDLFRYHSLTHLASIFLLFFVVHFLLSVHAYILLTIVRY